MDDWMEPRRSAWRRIEGDGEPTDFSEGASTLGDYRKPEPEPVPKAFRQAFDRPAPVPVVQPRPITPEPQRYPPVDRVAGFRAWVAVALRRLDESIKEHDEQ